MKISKKLFLSALIVCAAGGPLAFGTVSSRGCFFKSDCPDGKKCVIAKGEARGVCEVDPLARPVVAEPGKDAEIISCRYHSECGEGNICVKSQGAVTGVCKVDPLADEFAGIAKSLETPTDETRCSFNTDCKTGSICVKDFGQLTGTCQEPSILEEEKKQEKSIFDKTRKRQQCLMDTDCGINGICVTIGGSVFGECRDKSDPKQLFAP